VKRWAQTLLVVAVALAARGIVVAWAYDDIGPVADGTYYHVLGRRIAEGHGYTWLWPDGAVTFAAHYPVGYPALVALAYLVLGPAPGAAMVMNAIVGASGAAFMHRALLRVATPGAAMAGALGGFALHPALLSYTPALMTEGVCATFVAGALAMAAAMTDERRRDRVEAILALGAILGLGSLVRPQLVLLAPCFAAVGFFFAPATDADRRRRVRRGAKLVGIVLAVTACTLVVIGPWTARNCSRMGRCALVSMNGGWNLLIGTDDEAGGTWAPVETPPACVEVFDEAMKDRCFAREGARSIAERPGAWLALAPKKLSATFDHVGAGPWYLHDANPIVFPERARTLAALLEAIAQRALYALALAAVARALFRERRRLFALGAPAIAALVGAAAPGWITVLLFSAGALVAAASRSLAAPVRPALALAGTTTLLTAVTHVVFFGAGRYALIIVPALVLGAATLRPRVRAF
jgi:hypothetical protein